RGTNTPKNRPEAEINGHCGTPIAAPQCKFISTAVRFLSVFIGLCGMFHAPVGSGMCEKMIYRPFCLWISVFFQIFAAHNPARHLT
ncbi:MAG: hypothetical protein Q4E32_09760, partial [Bacteroidales bacterium]|nr:hypothetical protein [Bacteroidales bacterium]